MNQCPYDWGSTVFPDKGSESCFYTQLTV